VFFVVIFAFFLAAPLSAQARDTVWSALIFATVSESPTPPPPEIAAYQQKLQRIFGYNQFQILNQHREPMKGRADWLLPGDGFSLRIGAQRAQENYVLNIQLYQGKQLAVQTIALLARQSPIFLRGPLAGDGQIIVVIAVE